MSNIKAKTEPDGEKDNNVLEENTATEAENLTDENGANCSADTTDSDNVNKDSAESEVIAKKLEEVKDDDGDDGDDDGESADEEESAFPDTQIDLQHVTGSK